MRKFMILGAVALALAACQGGRGGYGSGSYEFGYGPNAGHVGANWSRQRDRGWQGDGYGRGDQRQWRRWHAARQQAPSGDP